MPANPIIERALARTGVTTPGKTAEEKDLLGARVILGRSTLGAPGALPSAARFLADEQNAAMQVIGSIRYAQQAEDLIGVIRDGAQPTATTVAAAKTYMSFYDRLSSDPTIRSHVYYISNEAAPDLARDLRGDLEAAAAGLRGSTDPDKRVVVRALAHGIGGLREQLGSQKFDKHMPQVMVTVTNNAGRPEQKPWNPLRELLAIAQSALPGASGPGNPELIAAVGDAIRMNVGDSRKEPVDFLAPLKDVALVCAAEAKAALRRSAGNPLHPDVQAWLEAYDTSLMAIASSGRTRMSNRIVVDIANMFKPRAGILNAISGFFNFGREHDVVTRRLRLSSVKAVKEVLTQAYFNEGRDPQYPFMDKDQSAREGERRIPGRHTLASVFTSFLLDTDPTVRLYTRWLWGRQGSNQNVQRIGLSASWKSFLGGAWSRDVTHVGLIRKGLDIGTAPLRIITSAGLAPWYRTPLINGWPVSHPHVVPDLDETGHFKPT